MSGVAGAFAATTRKRKTHGRLLLTSRPLCITSHHSHACQPLSLLSRCGSRPPHVPVSLSFLAHCCTQPHVCPAHHPFRPGSFWRRPRAPCSHPDQDLEDSRCTHHGSITIRSPRLLVAP